MSNLFTWLHAVTIRRCKIPALLVAFAYEGPVPARAPGAPGALLDRSPTSGNPVSVTLAPQGPAIGSPGAAFELVAGARVCWLLAPGSAGCWRPGPTELSGWPCLTLLDICPGQPMILCNLVAVRPSLG